MPSAKHRVVSFLTRSPQGSASSNQFKPNKQNCGRFQLVIPCPNLTWFQTWPPCLGKVWKALFWWRPGFSEALLLRIPHRFPGHKCFGSQRLNQTVKHHQLSARSAKSRCDGCERETLTQRKVSLKQTISEIVFWFSWVIKCPHWTSPNH